MIHSATSCAYVPVQPSLVLGGCPHQPGIKVVLKGGPSGTGLWVQLKGKKETKDNSGRLPWPDPLARTSFRQTLALFCIMPPSSFLFLFFFFSFFEKTLIRCATLAQHGGHQCDHGRRGISGELFGAPRTSRDAWQSHLEPAVPMGKSNSKNRNKTFPGSALSNASSSPIIKAASQGPQNINDRRPSQTTSGF